MLPECKGSPYLSVCLSLKHLRQFVSFINAGQHGAGNFEMLLLHVSFNLSQTLWRRLLFTMAKYKPNTFLGIQCSFEKCVALWNFNIGDNGKVLKWAIFWKWFIIDWTGWKFGTSCVILLFQFVTIGCTLKNFWC